MKTRIGALTRLFAYSFAGTLLVVMTNPAMAQKAHGTTDTMNNLLRITIGASTFTARLVDNAAVAAFKARLPMTVSMIELNGNEKYYNVPGNPGAGPLPTNASNPGMIQTGDLMLYGSNTLVLFYKSFSTPYGYTKLGRIDNPAGLEAALGSANVTVTFDLE